MLTTVWMLYVIGSAHPAVQYKTEAACEKAAIEFFKKDKPKYWRCVRMQFTKGKK